MKNKTKNTRQSIQHYVIMKPLKLTAINYRLMHALFHIKTPIIPRDRYRPEGFSPRDNIGRGMITVLIWKKAYINLFITYFNIELKRTNLTSHTDTQLMDMSDRYRLRVLLPKRQQIFPRWTSTFSKRQLTVSGSDVMGITRGLISCYQSFAPMADIAVALVDVNEHERLFNFTLKYKLK
jgi:hypothetical protein